MVHLVKLFPSSSGPDLIVISAAVCVELALYVRSELALIPLDPTVSISQRDEAWLANSALSFPESECGRIGQKLKNKVGRAK